MNVITVLLILFLVGAFGGTYIGWYPAPYGYTGGGFVLLILIVLLVTGRI